MEQSMHKHNKTWSYGSYLSGELTEGRMDPRATALADFLRFQQLDSLLRHSVTRDSDVLLQGLGNSRYFFIRFVPPLHVKMAIVGRNSPPAPPLYLFIFCGCFHLKDFTLGCFIDNGGRIKWLRN